MRNIWIRSKKFKCFTFFYDKFGPIISIFRFAAFTDCRIFRFKIKFQSYTGDPPLLARSPLVRISLVQFLVLCKGIKFVCTKGQLISKGLFGFFNSPKKRTANFCPSRLGQKLTFSSSCFGKIDDNKISFRD